MKTNNLTLQVHESPNRRVLEAANRFHDAATILYEVDALTVPTVVNAALALELYLKCLHANIHFQDGRAIQGGAVAYDKVSVFANSNREHEPHKLFRALPQDTRIFLDASFSKRFPLEREKLESVLERYQGIFVNWRYLFEGKGKVLNLSEFFKLLEFFKASTAEIAS
jgi:hypothetical protein